MSGKKVLFINHKDQQCGVYQYGVSIVDAFKASQKYEVLYAECASQADLDVAIRETGPAILIFNYYFQIMDWTFGIVKPYGLPSFGILHEGRQAYVGGVKREPFDYWLCPDPTTSDSDFIFRLVRLIPDFAGPVGPPPDIFTIGSFGFGFALKGFENLVELVQKEFERAHIRLHIPFNDIIDRDGHQFALATAERCRQAISKPGIELTITHDFKTRQEVLEFLAGNTMNAFLYKYSLPSGMRGISSAIDLALAVDRPIAVTRSEMFRHLFDLQPSICIEDNRSFQEIMSNYERNHLANLKEEWSEASFIRNLEEILDRIAIPGPAHQ